MILIRAGADPSLRDSEGFSCIHLAAQFGHTAIVAYLVAKGVNPNMLDRSAMTPLMWSAYKVNRYIEHRANVIMRTWFFLLELLYVGYFKVFLFTV